MIILFIIIIIIIIGTHDIQNISIDKSISIDDRGEVRITTKYFNHFSSSAMGAFVAIMFTDDNDGGSISFTRSVYLPLNKRMSQNYTLPFDLYPGDYLVYVYDIEINKRLKNGVNYPASIDQLLIRENTQFQPGEICNKVNLYGHSLLNTYV